MAPEKSSITWGNIRSHASTYTYLMMEIKKTEDLMNEIEKNQKNCIKIDDKISNLKVRIAEIEDDISKSEENKNSWIEEGSSSKVEKCNKKLEAKKNKIAKKNAEIEVFNERKREIEEEVERLSGSFDPSLLDTMIDEKNRSRLSLVECLQQFNMVHKYVFIMVVEDLVAMQFLKKADENKLLRFAVGSSVDNNGMAPLMFPARSLGIVPFESHRLYEIQGGEVRVIPIADAIRDYAFIRPVPPAAGGIAMAAGGIAMARGRAAG